MRRISPLICRQCQYILVTTLCAAQNTHLSPPQAHNLYVMTTDRRGNFSLEVSEASPVHFNERDGERRKRNRSCVTSRARWNKSCWRGTNIWPPKTAS